MKGGGSLRPCRFEGSDGRPRGLVAEKRKHCSEDVGGALVERVSQDKSLFGHFMFCPISPDVAFKDEETDLERGPSRDTPRIRLRSQSDRMNVTQD